MIFRKFFRHLCCLGLFTLVVDIAAEPVFAASSLETQIRDLRNTVQRLEKIVEAQSRRIEALTAGNPARRVSASPHAPEEMPPPDADKAASTGKPPPSASGEIETLLREIAEALPPAGSRSRSVGLWRYPTGSSAAAKLLPDISGTAVFSGAYFSLEPEGETGHDPARTGFNFQEFELALQSAIDPYFRYDVFLGFHEEGVELEEAYFTTLSLPRGLQVRGGKFLLPFGRQNPKHLHSWSFADNTLVNKYLLGPEGLGELGVELSYLFPLRGFMQLQTTFSNGDNETSFGGERKKDFLYQGRLSGSVDFHRDWTLLLGSSGAFGFNASGSGKHSLLIGGDLLLKWKPSARRSLTWQSEYIYRSMETPEGTFKDGGFYSYVDYQFLKRWNVALRYDAMGFPSGLLAPERRLTPALTFKPSEFSQLRLQYAFDKTRGISASHAAILQFMFSMGPHGAHPF